MAAHSEVGVGLWRAREVSQLRAGGRRPAAESRRTFEFAPYAPTLPDDILQVVKGDEDGEVDEGPGVGLVVQTGVIASFKTQCSPYSGRIAGTSDRTEAQHLA